MAADIFISYKREERTRILPLAQALERDGYTVWWDLDLVTGERWAARIKTELDAAKAVIVMWTAASVTAERTYASEWIELEANEAARQNKLTPVLLDDDRIPWTHQQKQYADLVGWRGDGAHPGYRRLLEGVERLAGKRSAPASPEVEAWIAAERAQSAQAYRDFLASYPRSRFSVLAKARSLELDEAAAWSTLGEAPSERELKVFLEEYPDGRFAEEAKKRLSKLKPQKFKLSSRQIAAWIGVPTAALTLLITVATFWDTYFPRKDGVEVEEAAKEPAAAAENAATEEETAPSAVDARTTPASVQAPLVRDPSSLPDFALFRECEGCPEMVVIPRGSFLMGSPAGEPGRDDGDEEQVSVSLGRFAVSRFPVTRGEYAAFSAATSRAVEGRCYTDRAQKGSWAPDPSGTWRDPAFAQTDRHPVVCVNWADASAFAAWTQRRTGQPYRLISEAEYEYSNRAGTPTAYFWGADINRGCVFANVADATAKAAFSGWTTAACNDGYERTSPVGAFRANPWGLFDATGNVWSWTADCYEASYANNPKDGSVTTTSNCANRVNRGGSWSDVPQDLRSAYRYGIAPSNRDINLGFRLARTL